MRSFYFKQPFIACFLLAAVCLIAACTKQHVVPVHYNYNPGTGSDTTGNDTSKADSSASFNAPTGIAVDAAGNIYVADYGNNLIRKITPAGVVSTLAGSGNQGDINGAASLASFNGPTSLAVDAAGNVYVADDNNNQVREINTAGIVSTLAGTDSTGFANGPADTATFFGPAGVAVDGSGNVYVADAGNNAIRMISSAGMVSTLAGSGNAGSTNGALLSSSFNNPTGVALDKAGNVYVADVLNNLIRVINPGSGTVGTLAGSGNTGSGDSTGTAASFYFPNSLAVDASGNVFVTEYVNNLIREITPSGTVTTFAGNGQAGLADSTGTAASFNGPSGVAIDAAGNLYIADTYNNVIRKITPAGLVSTIAGNGSAGSHNGRALASRKQLLFNLKRNLHRAKNNSLLKSLIKKRGFVINSLYR